MMNLRWIFFFASCTLSLIVADAVQQGEHGNSVSSKLLFQKLRGAGFSDQNKHHHDFKGTGCECVQNTCGCCVHMQSETLHLDDTGCVNITYLPDQYGFSLTFSFDGKIILNETLSAKNPPPICVKVPYVDEVSLCIDFYNLDVHDKTFTGCVKIEARLLSIFSEDWDLGCFKIPFSPSLYKTDPLMQQMHWSEFHKQHAIKQQMMGMI